MLASHRGRLHRPCKSESHNVGSNPTASTIKISRTLHAALAQPRYTLRARLPRYESAQGASTAHQLEYTRATSVCHREGEGEGTLPLDPSKLGQIFAAHSSRSQNGWLPSDSRCDCHAGCRFCGRLAVWEIARSGAPKQRDEAAYAVHLQLLKDTLSFARRALVLSHRRSCLPSLSLFLCRDCSRIAHGAF